MFVDDRPSWDDYYLAGAQWAAIRGDCRRAKVGALLVDRVTWRILGHGYNGTKPGLPGCLQGACPRGLLSYDQQPPGGDYSNCVAKHAEWNCLDWAQRHLPVGWDFTTAVMYVSRKPCNDCEDYLRTAGVARAVWPTGDLDLRPPKMG